MSTHQSLVIFLCPVFRSSLTVWCCLACQRSTNQTLFIYVMFLWGRFTCSLWPNLPALCCSGSSKLPLPQSSSLLWYDPKQRTYFILGVLKLQFIDCSYASILQYQSDWLIHTLFLNANTFWMHALWSVALLFIYNLDLEIRYTLHFIRSCNPWE